VREAKIPKRRKRFYVVCPKCGAGRPIKWGDLDVATEWYTGQVDGVTVVCDKCDHTEDLDVWED